MKKLLTFCLALTPLLTACLQEQSGGKVEEALQAQVLITCGWENPEDSKTSLGEGNKVLWQAGDQIKVFNQSTPDGVVFTLLQESAGTERGRFQGEGIEGDGPFYAVYPASVATAWTSTGISVVLPQQQVAAEDSFGPGTSLAFAQSDQVNYFEFQNAMGVISFTLDQPMNGIHITSPDGKALCGKGKVKMSSDQPQLNISNGQSDVYLDCKGISGTTYYIPLPVGTLSSGLVAEFIGSDGNVMVKSTSKNQSIHRSKIRHMPSVSYEPVCKAAFTEASAPGAYEGILPGVGTFKAKAVFDKKDGQYAFAEDNSDRSVRVQNYDEGWFVTYVTPKKLTVGSEYEIAYSHFLDGAASAGKAGYKLLLQRSGRAWFVASDGSGDAFIQLMGD